MKKLFALSALVILSVACSDGPSKLTDEQKATLFGAINDTSRGSVGGATRTQQFQQKKGRVAGESLPANAQALEEMGNAVEENCSVDFSMPGGEKYGMLSFKLTATDKVVGNQTKACPISTDVSFDISATQLIFGVNYAAKADSFKKLVDVVGAKLNAKFEGSGNESGGTVNLSGGGSLDSQKNGNVPVEFSGSASGNEQSVSGKFTTRFVFNGFTADINTNITNESVKYDINGEEMTEEQLDKYLEDTFSARQQVNPQSKKPAKAINLSKMDHETMQRLSYLIPIL